MYFCITEKKLINPKKNKIVMEQMFCFQCQKTAQNKGCTIKGVCGKDSRTAALMDTLLYGVKGIACVNKFLREKNLNNAETSHIELDALFCTITNANFDFNALQEKTTALFAHKEKLLALARKSDVSLPLDCKPVLFAPKESEYTSFRNQVAINSQTNEDLRSLEQLIM